MNILFRLWVEERTEQKAGNLYVWLEKKMLLVSCNCLIKYRLCKMVGVFSAVLVSVKAEEAQVGINGR